MASDGQVTLGDAIVKHGARKIRRLYNDKVLAGFAGSAADSFALFSRFEAKLDQYRGNLERSAVELAKDWRTDRALRRLEAMLVVADERSTFLLSGTGDLIEPDDGILGIGVGWQLRHGRRPGPGPAHPDRGPRHRGNRDGDRGRGLHLHERRPDHRRTQPGGRDALARAPGPDAGSPVTTKSSRMPAFKQLPPESLLSSPSPRADCGRQLDKIRGRPASCEARGRDCPAEPAAAPPALAGDGRRRGAQEHPDDRADRRREDRDRPPTCPAGPVAVPEGRSVAVHRGRLRGARCRVDDPRPGGDRRRHGARRARARGAARRRGAGRGAAARPAVAAGPHVPAADAGAAPEAPSQTRERLRAQLRAGKLDDRTWNSTCATTPCR